MFQRKISAWQNTPPNLIKIYQAIALEKAKLLENALDYIFTSQLNSSELIKEIIGISPSGCEAFKLLASHRSFLSYFSPTLTRSTHYLIVLCFLKECYLKSDLADVDLIKDFFKLSYWVEKHLGYKLELNKTYVSEIFISNNNINLSYNKYKLYPTINIKIIIDKYKENVNKLIYTHKPSNLKIENIYDNHDGRCQGIVRYWLSQRAKASLKHKAQKTQIMIEDIKNLEIKNNKLINSYTDLQISTYQNCNYWDYKPLQFIQDIVGTNQDIVLLFNNLSELMRFNSLDNLYVEIKTIVHAMGLVLNIKGHLLKIMFYDPNNCKLYWKIYLTQDKITAADCEQIITEMTYFYENKAKKLSLLASCYFLPYTTSCNQYIDKIKPINSSVTIEYHQQILLLSVMYNNLKLTTYLLLDLKIDPNYLHNGFPPIYSAVENSNTEITKLLLNAGTIIDQTLKIELLRIASKNGNLNLINIFSRELTNKSAF